MIHSNCANCGKEYEFEPKRGTFKFKFCSVKCRDEFSKKEKTSRYRICEHCGRQYWWESGQKSYRVGGRYMDCKRFCSYECGLEHFKENNRKAYQNYTEEAKKAHAERSRQWFKNASKEQLLERKNKQKETLLRNYGVDNPLASEVIKAKFRETWANRTEEQKERSRQKHRETCQRIYGVDSQFSSKEVRQKIRETNLAKYGVDNPTKSPEIQRKTEETNLKKYGCRRASMAKNVRQKIRESHVNKSEEEKQEIYDKRKQTCLTRYGVEYSCLSDDCVNANNRICSKVNQKFMEKLKEQGVSYESEFRILRYSYDVKVDDTLIEIDPSFTHNSTKVVHKHKSHIEPKPIDYHFNKTMLARQNGFHCIHIWDWDDQDKIVELLKPRMSIGCYSLDVYKVYNEYAEQFLCQHSLQNTHCGQNTVCLGLFNEDNLIQLMVFDKLRDGAPYEYELVDVCTAPEVFVEEGPEKLFNCFLYTYNPVSIVATCDNSKFNPDIYFDIGMDIVTHGKPIRHFFNHSTNMHITGKAVNQLLNENVLLDADFIEVYDCGRSTFVWHKENSKDGKI